MDTMPPPPPVVPPTPPTPAPQAPMASTPPPKKKTSIWVWVAVGCGGILVLGAILITVLGYLAAQKVKQMAEDFEEDPTRAAAELIVGLTPDLELIDTDDEGRVTVRKESTGEEMTLDLEDLQEGRLSFETDDGKIEVNASGDEGAGVFSMTNDEGRSELKIGSSSDDLPEWVPVYPNVISVNSAYSSETPEMSTGMVQMNTRDPFDEVLDHYTELFDELGFEIKSNSKTTTPQGSVGGLIGEHEDGRTLAFGVTESSDEGEVQIILNYSRPNT